MKSMSVIRGKDIKMHINFCDHNIYKGSGFSGLEVSVLAFGTQVRAFKTGQSRRIFRAKKSSAHLPSEGK